MFYFILFAAVWIMGMVLAQGFWSTVFAIFIPFWSWFLVAKWLIRGA
jgi:hypothetical protein